MIHKGINFRKLVRNYKNGWIAISKKFDRVIYHGKTLKETVNKTKNTKERVYYFPVEKNYSHLVGKF